ncbi:MAG: sulfatase-like hydrolase/transferase, partial [Proteobacteria bacterium]|nr:sulfatase-like hydrolase/transferase [Pseudomonadota bacterium]
MACLLTVAASAAAWLYSAREPTRLLPEAAPLKNLIMIVIDTQRTDVLGVYGAKYGASPHIDAFGAKSIVFENAWSQNTYTIGSFMSYMTSTHLRTHGLDANLGRGGICAWEDVRPLPEVLKDHGFTTRAYVSNPNLHPKKGFPRGFDTWNDQTHEDLMAGRKSAMSDQGVVRRAARDLATWEDERNFLYLHLMAPHLPQHPSKQAIKRFKLSKKTAVIDLAQITAWRRESTPEQQELTRKVYVASVWDGDRYTGAILDAIKQTGHHLDSLVLIMSDHGEELWEHGDYGHQDGVW